MSNRPLVGLALALALAGCNAAAPTNLSSTPAASTAPAASPAPATVPGLTPSVEPNFPNGINPKLAQIYRLGRIWEYETRTSTPMGPLTVTMRQEVMSIAGAKATLKVTTTTMGRSSDSTATVDLGQADLRAAAAPGLTSAGGGSWMPSAGNAEEITVKAGTFATTRFTGTMKDQGATVDATFWVSDEVGLVKSTSKTQAAALRVLQLPGGFQMPAGLTMPAGGATTSAPTASVQVDTTTELTGISPR